MRHVKNKGLEMAQQMKLEFSFTSEYINSKKESRFFIEKKIISSH